MVDDEEVERSAGSTKGKRGGGLLEVDWRGGSSLWRGLRGCQLGGCRREKQKKRRSRAKEKEADKEVLGEREEPKRDGGGG